MLVRRIITESAAELQYMVFTKDEKPANHLNPQNLFNLLGFEKGDKYSLLSNLWWRLRLKYIWDDARRSADSRFPICGFLTSSV